MQPINAHKARSHTAICHRATRLGAAIGTALAIGLLTARAEERPPSPGALTYAAISGSPDETTATPSAGNPQNAPAPAAQKSESLWTKPPDGNLLSFGLDYRYPLTGDYESFYGARLFMEMWTTPRQAFGMGAGVGVLRLESGSPADRAVHDPLLVDLGVFYRLYFTPPGTFLRPYGTLQLNLTTLIFDYREDPIADGDRIRRDNLGGGDAYVGVGVIANVTKNFHLFGELGYGGVAFFETTHADLKNRWFDNFGYVGLKTGVGLSF
jgi:hypothetical protein